MNKTFLKIAVLATASLGLSGCYETFGASYGYDTAYDSYGCDPYDPYDSYYNCDYRYGFNNIGYGGGWWDNYYYPGYGFYIFDRGGQRYQMRNHHHQYWGQRGHAWAREHGHRGRENGYGHNGKRGDDGHNQGRGYQNGGDHGDYEQGRGRGRGNGEGRRGRDNNGNVFGWDAGRNNGQATPPPTNNGQAVPRGNPVENTGRRGWRNGEGRRGGEGGRGGRGFGQSVDTGNPTAPAATPSAPSGNENAGRRGRGNGGNVFGWGAGGNGNGGGQAVERGNRGGDSGGRGQGRSGNASVEQPARVNHTPQAAPQARPAPAPTYSAPARRERVSNHRSGEVVSTDEP